MELSKQELDELVALMRRDGLDRLRVELGDIDIDLRMTMPVKGAGSAQSAARTDAGRGAAAAPEQLEAPANVRKVLAPLVGVFYRRPAPGADPFVDVGNEISAGQILCILEAMKLMNEIVSEHSGKIVRVCAKDGELVALQQELFWIET
ncbi:MAG: acetyl-CoA carboxylase, biotin carboxyl carrier protein [Candidatus Eremiobacteraeota bacterium]|nr:acetyl-CoA carboxylase, biotin carboxyl carrier protein [Candidatus Eremiobacteraeota bacterium]